MQSESEPEARTPRTTAPPPTVAIVDAAPVVYSQIEPVLHGAGLRMAPVKLADYPSPAAALQAMSATGVAVIVYELGYRHSLEPGRFHGFYAAAANQAIPIIIATSERWIEEESGGWPPNRLQPPPPCAMRLLRAVERALARAQKAA